MYKNIKYTVGFIFLIYFHTRTPACIYIYIYIVIHRQTVSFYQNSSVWLETQDARSQDWNPSNLDWVSDLSATKRTTLAKGIFKVFTLATAAVCLHFYTLSATRVLNSFEELCITLAAAGNSFARVLNPHGGAYILSSKIWCNKDTEYIMNFFTHFLFSCYFIKQP